jgi:hypothetical protein
MKLVATLIAALGIAGAIGMTTVSAQQGCVQNYDSSGAPTAPYCR